MPDGSSSAAPVMTPGPSARQTRRGNEWVREARDAAACVVTRRASFAGTALSSAPRYGVVTVSPVTTASVLWPNRMPYTPSVLFNFPSPTTADRS